MPDSRSILFVDDYDMLRQIYVEILTNAGYRVEEAADADQCMQVLQREIPDLILLDIMMKPVDGWEVLRQIRACPDAGDVPVIMVSGKAILPSEISEYGPMIDGFMRKPLLNEALLANIREFFSWFDALEEDCKKARFQGTDESVISSYRSLRRKERSLSVMLAMIRREYDTGGDKIASEIINEAMNNVDSMILDISTRIHEHGDAMHLKAE